MDLERNTLCIIAEDKDVRGKTHMARVLGSLPNGDVILLRLTDEKQVCISSDRILRIL